MYHSEIIINYEYHDFNPTSFGFESCEPEHDCGSMLRSHWLLHYIVSGHGEFTREGQTYQLGPGQIFVIPPYMTTYYKASKEDPWHYIWIGFTTDMDMNIFSQPVITHKNTGNIFQDMLSCQTMKSGRTPYLSACIWKLYALLAEDSDYTYNYVDEALHYIHAEYATNISIQQIAERLGLTRSYFFTIFKKNIGMSPNAYLVKIRLKRAEELIRELNVPPFVAASSVGYTDPYHFSKVFKKRYGVSPSEYAKRYHQKKTEPKS